MRASLSASAFSPIRAPLSTGGLREQAVWGHFGEILQGRLGPSGPIALLTLAARGVPALATRVRWRPAKGAALLVRGAPDVQLAAAAHRAGLRRARALGWGGRLDIETLARPGGGCGVSTSSLLAALRLAAPEISPEREATLLLALEGAVDPLMLEEPGRALWASREGRMVQRLPPPPPLLVVGGYDGPGRRTDPTEQDFSDVSDLVARVEAAARSGDVAAFAAVATASAERRQAAAPKPRFDALKNLARQCGALGVVVAHTGSAAGLLFAPDQEREARRAEAALPTLGVERPIRFRSGWDFQVSPEGGGTRATK